MKTIFSKVKLRSGQIVQLFLLVLLSAVGQMLLPSFLAQMISHGVAEGENRIVWMYAVIMAYIVIGRLQKEKYLDYHQYSNYKLRYKWGDCS